MASANAATNNATPPTAIEFEIHGKVQGVFFRKYTRKNALKHGCTGWVKNTTRGTVVGEAEGSPAAIAKLSTWLRTKGSKKSRIDRADIRPYTEKKNFDTFKIIR